jgi:predicted SAM-dependent methyltransferase
MHIKNIFKKILRYFGFELKKNENYHDTDLYLKLYGSDSVKNRRFYNISAGAYKGFGGGLHHPCWTNIDVDKSWKNDKYFPNTPEFNPEFDIAHDLLSVKPIPVETSSAELIHSRFAVDRITDEAARYFFNEAYRILKKGGLFRIVSTNADLDFRAYLNNDKDYFYWLEKSVSMEQAFLFHIVTQSSTLYHDNTSEKISDEQFRQLFKTSDYKESLNYCASKCSVEIHKNNRYDHLNWWNWKKYEEMLLLAGFKSIYLSAPDQSASPVLRNNYYFDNDHNNVMMYVEAVKT